MGARSWGEGGGGGPGRFKACWITAAPFIVSSTMVKMVVRTVALSSIGSALLVCLSCLQTVAYYSSHSLSAISTKRKCFISLKNVRKRDLGNGLEQIFQVAAVIVDGTWTLSHLSQFLDKGTGSWIVCYLWVEFPLYGLHAHSSMLVDGADRSQSRNYYDLPTVVK